jgi:hypothetical protein
MTFRSSLAVFAALWIALTPVGQPASVSSSDSASLAEVRISGQPGVTIPRGFMGLSHEWPNTTSMIGYSKTGANLVYRQLLTNLTAYGNDPIELRIGGNSTDNTGRPSGDRMKPYVELANALHARFILGVNFGSNDLSLTENQVKFYSKEMPNGSIEAFEIGNEPDAYPNR